jgi:hypothetical protein
LLAWEESDKSEIMARIVPNHSGFRKRNRFAASCRRPLERSESLSHWRHRRDVVLFDGRFVYWQVGPIITRLLGYREIRYGSHVDDSY